MRKFIYETTRFAFHKINPSRVCIYPLELMCKDVDAVTSVQDTSIASAMLSDGNMKFDLVMVDVSSTNLEGFKLVHRAIDLGYRVISKLFFFFICNK